MATAISFNGVTDRITIPVSGGTTASEPFSIPRGAKSAQIFVPSALVGTSVLIEALLPVDGVMSLPASSYTWVPVSNMDLSTAGTFHALAVIPKNACTTIPVSALGGGVLHFLSTATETTPLTITIFWSFDG